MHLLKHLSQAVTVGQAALPSYKQVNPLFFSSLSPFRSFWFSSLSSKTQRKACETVTIAADSLENRSVVFSLCSLCRISLFLLHQQVEKKHLTSATLHRNLAVKLVHLLVCLPKNDSRSWHYSPRPFCQLTFTTCVPVLFHCQNADTPDGTKVLLLSL